MQFYYTRSGIQMLLKSGPVFAFRALKYVLLKKLGATQVMSIFVCPSHVCNANCVHCYEKYSASKNHTLSTKEVKEIIDQFAGLGGLIVRFCSGEFLLRKDCYELVDYVTRKHMYCTITTNGLLLDEPTVDGLIRAGLKELIVSLDSANPERHDSMRGVKGCFERATNGIRIAASKGLTTLIWTYVSKSNYDELDAIARLGKELGAKYTYVFFTLLSGHYFDRHEENLTVKEREEFRRRFNGREDIRLEFPTEQDECTGGGKYHVCVMPSGDKGKCPVSGMCPMRFLAHVT